MLFKKDNIIQLPTGRKYQAVCTDEDIAIFAPVKRNADGSLNTAYRGMIAFANDPSLLDPDAYKRIELGDV